MATGMVEWEEILDDTESRWCAWGGLGLNRSDARSLWFHCLAIEFGRRMPQRWEDARKFSLRSLRRDPVRRPLFEEWLRILSFPEPNRAQRMLAPEAQQLRSVSPICAMIRGVEHRRALLVFQSVFTRVESTGRTP